MKCYGSCTFAAPSSRVVATNLSNDWKIRCLGRTSALTACCAQCLALRFRRVCFDVSASEMKCYGSSLFFCRVFIVVFCDEDFQRWGDQMSGKHFHGDSLLCSVPCSSFPPCSFRCVRVRDDALRLVVVHSPRLHHVFLRLHLEFSSGPGWFLSNDGGYLRSGSTSASSSPSPR